MHLSVAVVPAPGQVVVRITGDAGRPTLPRLAAGLTRAAEHGTASVVVDVAGARFRDGAALRTLAGFSDTLTAAGRQCRVVGAPAVTRRLVAEAGLAGVLELDGPLTGADPVLPRSRPTADVPAAAEWRPPAREEARRPRPAAHPMRGPAGVALRRIPVPLDRWR
ncbi:anti-anti-sigma factor [Geodermatophilus aquaeductus]|uniref:Anti-anti-sigma factor n=1 Tax=Geodermatophilus aquaeductus TaxID=1564161 RepID=A0A521C118_9ACTN|nr:STAS domain-containing protein [Geodermatophilus aquaeductus]SMO53162.1 anti-anti-sigma factor [Geodermatophilus aquaeductus]